MGKEKGMISNLKVYYEPGDHGCNGIFKVSADTPHGHYCLKQELPMELQSDDGLDWEETLNGVEVENGPDFRPPYTDDAGADLFAEKADEIVKKKLEEWISGRKW
jgi:hypothetical protein